jgi:hypothetical protein
MTTVMNSFISVDMAIRKIENEFYNAFVMIMYDVISCSDEVKEQTIYELKLYRRTVLDVIDYRFVRKVNERQIYDIDFTLDEYVNIVRLTIVTCILFTKLAFTQSNNEDGFISDDNDDFTDDDAEFYEKRLKMGFASPTLSIPLEIYDKSITVDVMTTILNTRNPYLIENYYLWRRGIIQMDSYDVTCVIVYMKRIIKCTNEAHVSKLAHFYDLLPVVLLTLSRKIMSDYINYNNGLCAEAFHFNIFAFTNAEMLLTIAIRTFISMDTFLMEK